MDGQSLYEANLNDYYIVLAPGDMTKSEDYDYNWYIVGE